MERNKLFYQRYCWDMCNEINNSCIQISIILLFILILQEISSVELQRIDKIVITQRMGIAWTNKTKQNKHQEFFMIVYRIRV